MKRELVEEKMWLLRLSKEALKKKIRELESLVPDNVQITPNRGRSNSSHSTPLSLVTTTTTLQHSPSPSNSTLPRSSSDAGGLGNEETQSNMLGFDYRFRRIRQLPDVRVTNSNSCTDRNAYKVQRKRCQARNHC